MVPVIRSLTDRWWKDCGKAPCHSTVFFFISTLCFIAILLELLAFKINFYRDNLMNEDEDVKELVVRTLFQESTGMSVNRPKFKTIGELQRICNGKLCELNALLNRIELTVVNCYASA